MNKTTIQISSATLERLKGLRRHERESYEEVLNNVIDEAESEELGDDEIDELQEALEEVRAGKTKPIEQVAKDLGIALR